MISPSSAFGGWVSVRENDGSAFALVDIRHSPALDFQELPRSERLCAIGHCFSPVLCSLFFANIDVSAGCGSCIGTITTIGSSEPIPERPAARGPMRWYLMRGRLHFGFAQRRRVERRRRWPQDA